MLPGARRFYAFLILVTIISVLFYLHRLDLLRTWRSLPEAQPHPPSFPSHREQKFAYATFLGPPTSKDNATAAVANSSTYLLDDPYFISVRLLNYQIKHSEQTRTKLDGVPFLVLVLPEVPAIQTQRLVEESATIVPIQPLDLPDAFDRNFIKNSRFRDVLSKLRLWQLTDYDKILYLDADSFLLDNADGIFTDPELSTLMKTLPPRITDQGTKGEIVEPPDVYLMAASTDTYGDQTPWEESPSDHPAYLCACFMLISPSTNLFDYYISVLTGPDAPPNAAYPEQDLLIQVHKEDGRMPWKRIPIGWSANDGEMNDELALRGGVKSLHIKGWDGAEGGNVANEKYRDIWRDLVEDMEAYYRGKI